MTQLQRIFGKKSGAVDVYRIFIDKYNRGPIFNMIADAQKSHFIMTLYDPKHKFSPESMWVIIKHNSNKNTHKLLSKMENNDKIKIMTYPHEYYLKNKHKDIRVTTKNLNSPLSPDIIKIVDFLIRHYLGVAIDHAITYIQQPNIP